MTVALHLATGERDVGDGAGGRAHSHADGAGFKGRTRRGGRADDSATVADGDFAVGAEIDQRHQIVAVGDAGGDDSGQDVGSDKAAETMREANGAGWGRGQPSSCGRKALHAQMGGDEGRMRERLNVAAGEQVMHDRVADEDDFGNLLLRGHGRGARRSGRERREPLW